MEACDFCWDKSRDTNYLLVVNRVVMYVYTHARLFAFVVCVCVVCRVFVQIHTRIHTHIHTHIHTRTRR